MDGGFDFERKERAEEEVKGCRDGDDKGRGW